MKNKELEEATKRALDWLEANPDKHIADDYARTEAGKSIIRSEGFEEACCFCIVGRIACEMNAPSFLSVEQALEAEGITSSLSIDKKDDFFLPGKSSEAIADPRKFLFGND